MELIVEGKGCFLGKHQGRLRVTREQKVVSEVPLIHLQSVLIMDNGVGISSDVVRTCSEEGIPIHFLSGHGNPIASLYSAGLTGTILTRRAQLLAYEQKSGILAAKAFISGKLENQANLLRYIAKYRKENNPTVYDQLMLVAVEMRDFLYELERLQADHIDVGRLQTLLRQELPDRGGVTLGQLALYLG